MLVSVWAPPHLVQQGQFAMEVAVSCLDFYTEYFGIPYQLPKIGNGRKTTHLASFEWHVTTVYEHYSTWLIPTTSEEKTVTTDLVIPPSEGMPWILAYTRKTGQDVHSGYVSTVLLFALAPSPPPSSQGLTVLNPPPADLVAIPDFAAGAMENWGLSTFRLTSLLYDSDSSSSSMKEWVTQVVAHELAHQVR